MVEGKLRTGQHLSHSVRAMQHKPGTLWGEVCGPRGRERCGFLGTLGGFGAPVHLDPSGCAYFRDYRHGVRCRLLCVVGTGQTELQFYLAVRGLAPQARIHQAADLMELVSHLLEGNRELFAGQMPLGVAINSHENALVSHLHMGGTHRYPSFRQPRQRSKRLRVFTRVRILALKQRRRVRRRCRWRFRRPSWQRGIRRRWRLGS